MPIATASTQALPQVDVWGEWLGQLGVDQRAIAELALLSQYSQEGNEMANDIIAKMLRREGQEDLPRKPGAFVRACVKRARAILTER